MAKFRQLHTSFWDDPLVLDFTPEQKYFYIYLLTNPNVLQSGIYEISLRQIEYHTGYNKDTILSLLRYFEDLGKINYSESTNEIAIINFLKYNNSNSPTVKRCIEKDLEKIKNKDLLKQVINNSKILGLKPFNDTVPVEYEGNNKNNNKNNNNNKKNNKNLEEIKTDFIDKVKECKKYEKHHESFISYWTETNENGKYRFMKEKFFDFNKRLARWNTYSDSFNGNSDKFPNEYIKGYSLKLDDNKRQEYFKHLRDNGWQSIYNPASGQTWRKTEKI